MTTKDFLLCLVTGKDNKTPDVGRILLIVLILAYIGLEIMDVYLTHTFECEQWATGATLILGGGGALLYLKKDTEPTSNKED